MDHGCETLTEGGCQMIGLQMIEHIRVSDEIWALRPDYEVLILTAEGLAGGPSDEESRRWLARAAEAAADPESDPHVAAWREAYQAFGAKPKRTRSSVDALLRRAGGGLPQVDRVVDAYNAVSVTHVLPIGGEDMDCYDGPARLIRAAGGEPFDTSANGEPLTERADAGEVVWRDDIGVTCRRWNWRQCHRTRITQATKNAFFVLERLAPYPVERLQAAAAVLAGHLVAITPDVRVRSRVISASHPGR
jgi:DNA/RNA-binding domain of Phe-tRNA-synthetase-like protein